MNNIEKINIDRFVGETLRLVRAVEALSTAGREYISQQIWEVRFVFNEMIKPQILDSPEVLEMERMLRAMDDFTLLSEREWRRLSKARKQAIEVMRLTAELVIRRFVNNVLNHGYK